jgi:hypothetical protein
MDYKHTRLRLVMTTKTTKMLCVGIAAIAFLLVTIPVLKSGIAYADSGDHGDHGDHDHDRDHGDHDHDRDHGDHGDHDHDRDHGDHGDHDHDNDDD